MHGRHIGRPSPVEFYGNSNAMAQKYRESMLDPPCAKSVIRKTGKSKSLFYIIHLLRVETTYHRHSHSLLLTVEPRQTFVIDILK